MRFHILAELDQFEYTTNMFAELLYHMNMLIDIYPLSYLNSLDEELCDSLCDSSLDALDREYRMCYSIMKFIIESDHIVVTNPRECKNPIKSIKPYDNRFLKLGYECDEFEEEKFIILGLEGVNSLTITHKPLEEMIVCTSNKD